MIHQTANEKTENIYESLDSLVSVRVLDDPRRYPRHEKYKVVVFRLTPKPHTRIRDLGNGLIEFLPSNEELGAFLRTFDRINGKFPLSSGLPLKNKPLGRKRYHDEQNARRNSRTSHRN